LESGRYCTPSGLPTARIRRAPGSYGRRSRSRPPARAACAWAHGKFALNGDVTSEEPLRRLCVSASTPTPWGGSQPHFRVHSGFGLRRYARRQRWKPNCFTCFDTMLKQSAAGAQLLPHPSKIVGSLRQCPLSQQVAAVSGALSFGSGAKQRVRICCRSVHGGLLRAPERESALGAQLRLDVT